MLYLWPDRVPKAPPINAAKTGSSAATFSPHLEAIRGFAALLVVWHHAISFPNTLDPQYTAQGFFAYLAPSHFSVLLFFVLSGYVIGLTNQHPLTKVTIKDYVRKRAVRIYPIYFICILFTILVGWQNDYSWLTILGNLAFVQLLLTAIIKENAPSWSLHFEVLYYLLFIPISFFRVRPVLVAIGALLCGIGNLLLQPSYPLLSSYGFGFTFWLAGLTVARYASQLPTRQPSYQLLLALLLLFASFRGFDAPETIFRLVTNAVAAHRLEYAPGDTFTTIISFYDLAWLPYAVVGVSVFAHKTFRFQKILLSLLFLLPAVTWVHIAATWTTRSMATHGLASVLNVLALVLFFSRISWVERLGKSIIEWFSRIGSISYGLYIVHFPLLLLLARLRVFSGSALTHWVRFGLFLVLALLAAYFLEKKLQPWAKARLA